MRPPTSKAPMTWMRHGLAALATALVAAAGSPAEAHAPGVVLSAFGSATVDGVLGPGEWDAAARVDFTASLPGGGTVPATLFVMNDRTTLYIAVRLSQGIVATDTALTIAFDNAHRGQIVVGDDAIVVTPIAGAIGDAVVTVVQGGRATETAPDTGAGGANNGAAAYVTSGATSVYEIAHPLASGDGTRDFALAQGATVGFALSLLIAQGGLHQTVTQFPAEAAGLGDIVIASPVRVTLSTTQLRTGDPITLSLTAQNLELSSVDLYFGALLPNGLSVVFFSSPGVIGRAAGLSQPLLFLPIQAISARGSLTLPPATMSTLGVPPGTYFIFAVLARQGAFSDNRNDAGDILAIDLKPLTVLP